LTNFSGLHGIAVDKFNSVYCTSDSPPYSYMWNTLPNGSTCDAIIVSVLGVQRLLPSTLRDISTLLAKGEGRLEVARFRTFDNAGN
jgi:hypothetical protein